MKTFHILDWPTYRYYSDSHPLYRWKSALKNHGIKVDFYFDHQHKKLKQADCVFIHSRYFEHGWQDVNKRNGQNEAELVTWLLEMRNQTSKIIWFDAADSTGSADFLIIPYVDAFVKKQLHKDLSIYTRDEKLRLWVDTDTSKPENSFDPCPAKHLHKIKLGWNIGLNDYRYFGYKMSRLSNYLSYSLYKNKYRAVEAARPFDLTFRGRIHSDSSNSIAWQRNQVLKLMGSLQRNISTGNPVEKKLYWKELSNSKLSISPFGWGEVCYRDFESFISGAVLVKPSMNHLTTYPDVYQEGETYMPVSWQLHDLKDKLEYALDNYNLLKQIAKNGQENYQKAANDGEGFVEVIKNILS